MSLKQEGCKGQESENREDLCCGSKEESRNQGYKLPLIT